MPIKAKRVCQRCRKTFAENSCPDCTKEFKRKQDKKRGTAHSRGYDIQWQKVRKQHLWMNPICECGCEQIATVVHHVVPIELKPELRLVDENLMSLTFECHEKLHGRNLGKLGDRAAVYIREVVKNLGVNL